MSTTFPMQTQQHKPFRSRRKKAKSAAVLSEEDHHDSTSTKSAGKMTIMTAPLSPGFSFDHSKIPESTSTLSSASFEHAVIEIDVVQGTHQQPPAEVVSPLPFLDGDLPQTRSDPAPRTTFDTCDSSSPLAEAFYYSTRRITWRRPAVRHGQELVLPDLIQPDGSTDDGSVMTNAYFEATDLDASNWLQAIKNMDGPTFGLAVVALATAIVHPVLFVAGALAAFGTFHAVGAGYEYCSGGKNKDDDRSLDQVFGSICFRNGATSDTAEDDVPATQFELDVGTTTSDSNVVSMEAPLLPPPPPTFTSDAQNMVQEGNTVPIQPTPDGPPLDEANQEVTVEMLHQFYPTLDNIVVEEVEFPGLNAMEFFQVFFADDAPYNFQELQKKRGDTDISYGNWEELVPLSCGQQLKPSLHVNAPNLYMDSLQYQSLEDRILTFKAKTNNIFGPVYATTKKTQRLWMVNKRLVVMESRTDLSDIPFCDRFYVMERWIIQASKQVQPDGSGKKYVSTLTATSEVFFTKKCQFESQIRTKSVGTIEDIVKTWCIMATEALKLTEQRKVRRLNKKRKSSSTKNHQRRPSEGVDDTSTVSVSDWSDDENVPPQDESWQQRQEEGIEVTLPDPVEPRHLLKHSDSAPLTETCAKSRTRFRGFQRSVSNMMNGAKRQ